MINKCKICGQEPKQMTRKFTDLCSENCEKTYREQAKTKPRKRARK